jgi:hypothetical protein
MNCKLAVQAKPSGKTAKIAKKICKSKDVITTVLICEAVIFLKKKFEMFW